MRTSPTRKKRAFPPPDRTPPGDVQGLLECLIKQLEGEAPAEASCAHPDEKNVMLDVQVGGVRCLVTRVPKQPARRPFVLSPREREIARMVASGYPNKTIAGVLDISSWTVGTYIRRIFAKLNVNSRAAM